MRRTKTSALDASSAQSPRIEPGREAAATHSTDQRTGQDKSGQDNLRALKKGLRICRRGFVSVGVFSVIINLLMLTIPIYLFQLSDRVLTSRNTDTLIMLSVVAVGAIMAMVALDMLRRLMLSRIGTRLETTLAGPALAGALHAQASATAAQALRSLQQVRNFIIGPVMPLMFDAPLAPLYFAVVFLIHPTLGFIALGAGLLLCVVAVINQKVTASPFAEAGGHSQSADNQAEALSRNSQALTGMGMTNEGVMIWGQSNAQALTSLICAQDRNAYLSGFSKLVRMLTQIAVLGTGAYLALQGQLTGGMMIAASIIAGRALAPIEGAIEGWRSFVQARQAYQRVKSLIEPLKSQEARLMLPEPKGELSVDKLLYVPKGGRDPVLNGVNMLLQPGEALAVVGPSGGGKSTLARIMVGGIAQTAGKVRLDGAELKNWNPRQLGETIGYLPQDVELFPGTIKANIARLREDASDAEVYRAAQLAGVHEMILRLPQGYETMIAADGSPLSGGQRQRVGLARAFFGSPKLLVLDEPNANLDVAGERALRAALKHAKEHGITVVLVTQRLAILEAVDKVMVLQEGRVAGFGPAQDIIPRLLSSQQASQPQPQSEPQPQRRAIKARHSGTSASFSATSGGVQTVMGAANVSFQKF
jgi:ATP-binding cassette, subfamily C, bacterial